MDSIYYKMDSFFLVTRYELGNNFRCTANICPQRAFFIPLNWEMKLSDMG